MRFKDAGAIHTAVDQMRLANYPVARNRSRINDLFNGNPPWTEEERKANKIFTNVNPLYGTRIAHNARQNLDNAILKPGHFFDITLDIGPAHKRQDWSFRLSKEVNRILKLEQRFTDMWSSTNAQVVLHGIGPIKHNGLENPIPYDIGIEDVLVPAQTYLHFDNLEFFGVYRQWTYAELYDMTHGTEVDPGWNMAMVDKLLKSLQEQSLQSTVMGQRWLMPEKLAEDLKENAGLFMTSAAPTIFVWDFYFRDYDNDSDDQNWSRRIVLDYMQLQPEASASALASDAKSQFLYEYKLNKGVYATSLDQIIHFQIGNCSNVAPFRYYSVRSLGFLMYAVCQIQNRYYNRAMDAGFSNLLTLFRNVGEDDRERLEKVDLWHMGIVPDGLSFVTAAERHEVNQQLIEMMMAMNRQLMAESSSSWIPEIDTGTSKEQTLGEARIRLQTAASLSNALLNQTYMRAERMYREICRRFCMKGSRNRLVKEFHKRIQAQGIPMEILDVDHWDIRANRVLGGGNKALESLQADKLMAVRAAHDPEAQRRILYLYDLANTDDPQLAGELVPMDEKPISDATQLATLAMGTLLEGLPVVAKRGINEIDYIGTLLQLSEQVLNQIAGLEQVPETTQLRMQKISGETNVLEHVDQHLQTIAQDPSVKMVVKGFEEALSMQLAAVNKFAQHLSEEMEQQSQMMGNNPQAEEAMKLQAKTQAMLIEAESRARMKEADHAQKQMHKDAQWANENERRNATTEAEIERKRALTQVELASQMAKTRADIMATDLTTAADIRRPKPQTNGK